MDFELIKKIPPLPLPYVLTGLSQEMYRHHPFLLLFLNIQHIFIIFYLNEIKPYISMKISCFQMLVLISWKIRMLALVVTLTFGLLLTSLVSLCGYIFHKFLWKFWKKSLFTKKSSLRDDFSRLVHLCTNWIWRF